MKIKLPETYDEMSVGQYMELWEAFEREQDTPTAIRRCLEILADLDQGALNNADWNDIDQAAGKLRWLLDEPDPFTLKMELKQKVYLEGRWYGFIPDWSKLTVAEYADLETYCNQGLFMHLDRAMSVMYRPITKEAHGMYDIETYEPSKERRQIMRDSPMSVCVSAVVFFCSIQRVSATTTQHYSKVTAAGRQTRYKRNGGGTG